MCCETAFYSRLKKLLTGYTFCNLSQDDEDGGYLVNSNTEKDVVDDNNDPIHNAHLDTNFPYDFEDESNAESAEIKNQ